MEWGLATFVGLFAAASCIGALNGFILLQGEMPLVMARGGGFSPHVVRQDEPCRHSSPAHLLSSLQCTSLLLKSRQLCSTLAELFQFMILLATSSTLVLSILPCSLTALRLQQTRVMPLPALAAVASLVPSIRCGPLIGAGAQALKWGAVPLVVGGVIYAVMRFTLSQRSGGGFQPRLPNEAAELASRSSGRQTSLFPSGPGR